MVGLRAYSQGGIRQLEEGSRMTLETAISIRERQLNGYRVNEFLLAEAIRVIREQAAHTQTGKETPTAGGHEPAEQGEQ